MTTTVPVTSDQKTQKKSTNRKFVFGLASTADRQQQLLFSEYHSDVVFRVGAAGELIHAHKMILTIASEVFYAQFNGDFAESKQDNRENPVDIEDIEPAIFREVLRYIYCEKVFLTAANVMHIYYASQKYMLTGLNGVCESFLKTSINEANVLKVLDENRRYSLAKVDELCLKIIQDNPIKCFESEDFLTLSEPALKLIAACETMNCQKVQLLEAIQKWCKKNDSQERLNIRMKDMQCRKLYSFSTFDYSPAVNTHFDLKVTKNLYLYGLGIFVGKREPVPPAVIFQNLTESTAKITVSIEPYNVSVAKSVRLKQDLFIQDIVFEKLTIAQECRIKVDLVNEALLSSTVFFHLNEFKPVDNLEKIGLAVSYVTTTPPAPSQPSLQPLFGSPHRTAVPIKKMNCVAYLLYNVD